MAAIKSEALARNIRKRIKPSAADDAFRIRLNNRGLIFFYYRFFLKNLYSYKTTRISQKANKTQTIACTPW